MFNFQLSTIMMKKLLSVSIAMLMTVGAMAQWVQPAMKFVPFQTVEDFETSGTYFYLYNVEAQAFFCAGNAWGTQMSISANPIKIYFQKNFVDEETEAEWAEFPHYILRDSVPSKSSWMTTFLDGNAAGYCDGLPSDQNNFQGEMWEIFENDDEVYSFQIAPSVFNVRFTDNEVRMGVDLSVEGNTVVSATLEPWSEPYEGAYAMDWSLVEAASYENLAEDFALYNRAMQLQSLLEGLKAEYSEEEIDFTFADGVFANTASTMEELDSAMTNLNEGKAAADLERYYEEVNIILEGASQDDPRDGTSLIKNPNFDSNADNWNFTIPNSSAIGRQGDTYTNGDVTISSFGQTWKNGAALSPGKISQVLPKLPAGKYSIAVTAIAVNQRNGDPTTGVELFAIGGTIETALKIATGNNAPERFEFNFVSDGGDVEIGLRVLEGTTANWVAVDDWELWFYGEFQGDPNQEILNDYIAVLEEKYSDIDGKFLNAEVKQALLDEIEKAKDATEGFQEEKALLEELAASVDASIADYQKFYSAMEYADNRRLEFEDTWPDLSELIADLLEFGVEGLSEEGWNQMYEDGTAESELCNNARETVEQIIADYISANLQPGDFVTPLIKNPDFKDGFDSWSNTGNRPAFGGKAGNGTNTLGDIEVLESGNAEVYCAAFDMFQTIKNMPKGSFTLTCQAFQRNQDNDRWVSDYFVGPEEGITAVLYANEFESKICNFAAGAQEYEVFHSSNESWESDIYNETIGGYLPNSMSGANFFFNISPETYQVKVNFTLAEAGKDITIGLKNAHTNSWVIFDNFNLVYNGADAEAYKDAINDLVANLQNALPEDVIASSAAQAKVDAAITSLLAALASGDVTKCVDAIKEGTDALAYAKASVEAYAAVEKAYNDLNDALIKWGETAHDDAILAANEALADAEEAMASLNNTNEELAELVQKMNDCAKGLMPVIYDVDLLPEDFCSWDQPEAGAVKIGQAGCAYDVGISTGMPYGDGNVYYLNFADLSNANRLTIVATEGQPRCLFNRITDGGTVQVEVPRDADYWTITDNGDGSKTYVVDIARIVAEYGYCHLHAVKGANWVNTTVLSMKVGYGENDLPDAINTVKKATTIKAAGIYTLSGAKVNSLQRGMNIIVSEDGKVSKRFIK